MKSNEVSTEQAREFLCRFLRYNITEWDKWFPFSCETVAQAMVAFHEFMKKEGL